MGGFQNPQITGNPALAALAPQSRVPEIIAGTVAPFIVGTILVAARFYTRVAITRNLGSEDYVILIAWIFGIGIVATNILLVKYGAGHHAFLQSREDIIETLKLAFVGRIIYLISITAIKVGIGIFYLRIFSDRTGRIWIYSITVLIGAGGVALLFSVVFQCVPAAGSWNLDPNAKCYRNSDGLYSNAIINIAGDLALMAFVIPRILPLRMSKRQKIPLLCIVSLGILVIIATGIRLQKGIALNPSSDISWNASDITTWTSVEINVALFCSCAPTARPLIRQVMPGFMSTDPGPSQFGNSKSYAIGNRKSQFKKENGFELQSANGVDLPIEDGKSFWGKKQILADDDSEKIVLGRDISNNSSEILKTVDSEWPSN